MRNQGHRGRYLPIAVKLSLVITLLIVITTMALGALIMREQTWLLEQQIGGFGRTLSEQTAQLAQEPLLANDTLSLEVIANNLQQQSLVKGVLILDDQFQPKAQSGEFPDLTLLNQVNIQQGQLEWYISTEQRIGFIAPITLKELTVGYVILSYDHGELYRIQNYTLNSIVITTLLFILIGIIVSFIIGKRLTRPIHELVDMSKRISEGEFGMRLPDRRRDELGALMHSMNTMSEGLYNKTQIEQAFSRYVSPKVANEVLSNIQQVKIGGEVREASVLFADVIGFTQMSEKLQPSALSQLLNEYFEIIAKAAHAYNGHVDKYMGDCAMLVFGVPEEDSLHAINSVACALLIKKLVEHRNQSRLANNQLPLEFHIGVNTGDMLAGNMGAEERMEYTVVGDAVNLASRLSTSSENNDVILSELVLNKYGLAEKVVSEPMGSIDVRGKTEQISIHRVIGLRDHYQAELNEKLQELINVPVFA